MHAIISDIHGNLEALNAVLARIDNDSVNGLICLGDLVGYGPDSIACLRLALQWPVVIAGDWDASLVDHDPTQWHPELNRHIAWILRQLASASDADELLAAARQFKTVHEQFGCVYAHAAPGDVRDFIFPEDIYNPAKLDRIASTFAAALFVGHTHIPGLFVRNHGIWKYLETAAGYHCDISDFDKVICNVGSVGQPRDGDPRASSRSRRPRCAPST
jgi:predicted phosphodiesterase